MTKKPWRWSPVVTHLVKCMARAMPPMSVPSRKLLSIQAMGFGWESTHKSGKGVDTITSGLEGPWTANPTQWDNGYFDLLFKYEWALTKSPAGANIWQPVDVAEEDMAPQVDGSGEKVTPAMSTADIAMIRDPNIAKISEKFHQDNDYFADAFARSSLASAPGYGAEMPLSRPRSAGRRAYLARPCAGR